MRTLRRQSRIDEVPVVAKISIHPAPDHILAQEAKESGNKPDTNRAQTDNKVDTGNTVNRTQTGNKVVTKKLSTNESGNKLVTEPDTQVVTKWEQTEHKVVTKATFSALVGLQRNIMLFLYGACKAARGRSTDSLTLEHVALSLKITSGSVKTTIRRLEDKGHIKRGEFKNGRGGWSKYELAEATFREMLQLESEHKLVTNWTQSSNKVVTEPDTQPDTRPLSSSSYNLNTTTNYQAAASEESTFKIPEELRKLGFSENHLAQLKRDSKLPLELISASIEALAYDLTFDDVRRKIRSPIGLIMKLLKAGELYLSEKGFESEADRLFRECVQRAEKQKEEKTKLMEKFFDLKFEEWIEPMANEDLLKISQPVGELKGPFHIQQLKEHFRKEIFDIRPGENGGRSCAGTL